MANYLTFRWILLGIGLTSIVSLTGMNVYSLYSLHVSTVSNSIENQKNQLSEVSEQVRSRFRTPVKNIWKLNMEHIQFSVENDEDTPDEFLEMLGIAAVDPIFTEIYFSGPDCNACDGDGRLQRFNPVTNQLEWVNEYPDIASDGLYMARIRMLALIDNYRWKTRVLFDTHRSMTIALINPGDHTIVGYLNFVIKTDFLINNYLGPLLSNAFADEKSGINVWLYDWTKDEVLYATDLTQEYERSNVDIIQQFPDLLDDWNLKASVNHNPALASSRSSFYTSLSVMGTTVLFLIGAMVFMFITAQRERNLAISQAGFLANVTHELKTPLSVMQAAGENLADGRVNNKKRLISYGEHIFSEAVRLRQMIDKMLDVAKADAGKLVQNAEPLHLNKTLQSYLDSHASYLEQKGFTLQFVPGESDPVIFADEDNLKTILTNLIENAVKYSSDEKLLKISVNQNDINHIRIDIEDKGAGIPRKDQKRIFEKFYRVEDTLTAKTKGHGLGLSIVRNLTILNGGKITLKSTHCKGSTFSLHFPVHIKHEISTKNDKRDRTAAEYITK